MQNTTLLLIFYLSLFGALFSYLLYPVILLIIKGLMPSSARERGASSLPTVSLIITVHNEEKRIQEKLENTLQLDYPPEKLQVVVASDASTDRTNSIVREYAERGVDLVEVAEHKGKENAQLSGINAASGEIIVFSDVATKIDLDGLQKLVRYFDNPEIGAVSSEDKFVAKDGKVAGEGAYVKYEMWLRRAESSLAGLVGLSGSFFAARKSVCVEWDIYSPSDFNTALNCAKQGVKAVTMPDVFGYYQDLADPSKEYQRKIRTLIRGFTAISRHKEVLNPFSFGLFAFQVWSHKIMRWLVPWFLLSLAISSLLLVNKDGFYLFIVIGQMLFYGVVLLAWILKPLREQALFKIPYFFCQVNLAIAHAALQFISGKRMYTWTPSKR